jgi:TolB-like protein
LITDLSQSKHIKVLSAERLFNILQQLNQLEAGTYSSEVIKEVAARGGIESVLVGNFTRADDTFRINATLQEARSGELIGSESVEGHGEKDFYAMVDELTRKIKENFKLSESEIATDIDKEVEEITSASTEAFKHYSEGRRYHLNGDYPKSVESMLKAVEIDPEFAMAYRSLANASYRRESAILSKGIITGHQRRHWIRLSMPIGNCWNFTREILSHSQTLEASTAQWKNGIKL